MNQVPNMISTKDFAYLSDIFEWNMNASKEANHYSGEVTMENVKAMIEEARSMHTNHAQKIVQLLGGNYE